MKLGLIGYGNIGCELVRLMTRDELFSQVETTALVRPGRRASISHVHSIEDLLATSPGLVIEAAGHGAVEAYVGPCLAAGVDVVVASVGALADDALRSDLASAAMKGGARLILPSGAIGGIDMLAALKPSGISSVIYTGRKPPAAWRGSIAEDLINLDVLESETVFFEGNAREAARRYPKNANVAATIALAGRGLDQTSVRLIADPNAEGNSHEYSVIAGGANYSFSVEGKPSIDNPKTSVATVLSLLREVRNRIGPLAI